MGNDRGERNEALRPQNTKSQDCCAAFTCRKTLGSFVPTFQHKLCSTRHFPSQHGPPTLLTHFLIQTRPSLLFLKRPVYRQPAMEETQLFRSARKVAVEKIPCDHVGGQTIIFWDDIEQVFPGVSHIRNGDTTVKLLRDSNGNR